MSITRTIAAGTAGVALIGGALVAAALPAGAETYSDSCIYSPVDGIGLHYDTTSDADVTLDGACVDDVGAATIDADRTSATVGIDDVGDVTVGAPIDPIPGAFVEADLGDVYGGVGISAPSGGSFTVGIVRVGDIATNATVLQNGQDIGTLVNCPTGRALNPRLQGLRLVNVPTAQDLLGCVG